MVLARLTGNRVLWWAQGIGPLTHPLARLLTGLALTSSDVIAVRDSQSQQWVTQLAPTQNTPAHLQQVADPVWLFEMPPVSDSQVQATTGVGISLREWPTLTNAGLKHLAQRVEASFPVSCPVVLLSFQDAQDRCVLNAFSGYLNPQRPVSWGSCTAPDIALTLQGLHCVMAMRFHALILATLCQKPVFVLSYDPKVSQLAERLQVPFVPVEALSITETNPLTELILMLASPTAVAALIEASSQNRSLLETLV